MKEIGFEELKKVQLEILLEVHDFCMANNIEYSLAAGTLIGAIRHKGYIPWDDDIDICMTRPNYNRFIDLFNGYNEHLQVLAPEINPNYYAPYANVCDKRTILNEGQNRHNGIEVGVKIDIFPIDGAPSNIQEYRMLCNTIYDLLSKMWIKRCKLTNKVSFNNLIFILNKILCSSKSYSSLQKRIMTLAQKYDYNNSDFACLVVFDPIAFRAPKSVFESYEEIEFEGHNVRTVKDYDIFMKLRYGNYMKLPPENKRIAHHHFKAYWKD